MIKFSEIQIHNKNNYQELKKQIKSTHIDNFVIERLEKYLGIKCDTVLVEYPYYDSDYLSNYYSHYAQKFRKYDKACYRVHFEFKNEYIGYTVLRPTSDETKFGKTYLNPQLLLKNKAYLMLGDFKAPEPRTRTFLSCFFIIIYNYKFVLYMSCYDAKIIKIMRTDVILMIFNTNNRCLSFYLEV